jgi:hypothetical protein
MLSLFIVTAALNLALDQRGMFLLHASAVNIGDACIAFMGRSGWGKSTMAAYMQAQGFPIIADDTVVIDFPAPEQVVVQPAFSQIKLWPDVVQALNGLPKAERQPISSLTKHVYSLELPYSPIPVPLKGIFLLGIGEALAIESLNTLEGFKALLVNSYIGNLWSRQIDPLAVMNRKRGHLSQCTHIAEVIPIYCLKRPWQLADLPNIFALIRTKLAL